MTAPAPARFAKMYLAGLAAALATCAALAPLGSASQEPATSRRPFKLRANFDDMPQLSPDDLGSGSSSRSRDGGKGESSEVPIASIPFPTSLPDVADTIPETMPARVPHPSSPSTLEPSHQDQPQQAPAEQGRIEEYGIDWSGWITQLTDRWYHNLKRLEEESGLQFNTPRLASIQFTCYANGQIGNVFVRESCGVPLYDQMQMRALLQTLPIPPFPQGTRRISLTLVQGWGSHPLRPGEQDYRPGTIGKGFPMEKIRQWISGR